MFILRCEQRYKILFSMRGSIIISVTDDIITDQRVLKMAEVLSGTGHDIIIVGRQLPGSLPAGELPYTVKRFRMVFRKGFLFYKFFNMRLFFFLLFHRSCLLVSNDLDTLLPNYLVSRIKKVRLVFDSHEYFTGVPELENRPFVKSVWKSIERFIIPRLEYIITVNDSLADIYRDEYGVDAAVVRNIGKAYGGTPTGRSQLGVDEDDLLLVLQGRGINKERGAEELVGAVALCEGVHLLIIGAGDIIENLKKRVATENTGNKISFLPVMEWSEMMSYTATADAGLSLDKGAYINSKYSLPNKIFDYINAGIAVIASDLPEIEAVINKYNCGLLVKSVDPRSIRNIICLLRDEPGLLERLKKNSVNAGLELSWESERLKVKEVYERAGMEFIS